MNARDAVVEGARHCPLCGRALDPGDGHETWREGAAVDGLQAHDRRWHGGAVAAWLRHLRR